ncbi:STT3 domain-containing protein [Helicobacter burdigaliensis]|uniref:STT3 domain-containing protein n=1 Tax=Helicobacter burdigaliensis TaxID=2315334 RepID=UPI0039E72D28
MSVKNTENAKQEEAHNSQRDNLSSSLLGASLLLKNLYKNPFYYHFIFVFLLIFFHIFFHTLDYYTLTKDPKNFFEDTLILTSYDSYFYAKSTKEFLESFSFDIPLLSFVAGIFAKVFGLSFTLSFLSVIASASFGVILYIWCFVLLKEYSKFSTLGQKILAFLGAFLALSSPHFYQRTGAGYFDTDMLILSLPLLSLLFLYLHLLKANFKYLIFFSLFGLFATIWHNGVQNILFLSFLLYLFISFVLYFKKSYSILEILQVSSLFLIVLVPTYFSFFALFILLCLFKGGSKKLIFIGFLIALIFSFYFGLFNPIISQIKAYLFGKVQYSKHYIYASVISSILETTPSNFTNLIARSGGMVSFFLGIFGFLVLGFYNFTKKSFYSFALLLPFCLLGFASFKLGVRFSMFLAPILALGFVVIFVFLQKFLKKATLIFSAFCFILVLVNLSYTLPKPILDSSIISSFKALDQKIKKGDILFSWWDYGYALSYFTKGTILIDGGRHSGGVNYPISLILLSSSSNLAKNLSLALASKMEELPKSKWNFVYESLLQDYKANPKDFQTILEKEKPLLIPKGDVYWVLPTQMLALLKNIDSFSSLNILNGKKYKDKFFLLKKDSLNLPTTHKTYSIYEDFYALQTQNGLDLTTICLQNFTLLLDNDYFYSNIISWLAFKDNQAMELIEDNKNLLIYKVKKE